MDFKGAPNDGTPIPWASYATGVSYGNRGSNIGCPEKKSTNLEVQ